MTRKERAITNLKQMCSDGRYLGSGSHAPLEVLEDFSTAIKALEQEPTNKNDLGVDCISRTRAIERLKLNFPISQGADNSRDRHRYMQALADLQAIKELPSVTPIRPKGRWCPQNDDYFDWYECSECGYGSEGEMQYSSEVDVRTNYCPNCGCAMVEPQESEDKE